MDLAAGIFESRVNVYTFCIYTYVWFIYLYVVEPSRIRSHDNMSSPSGHHRLSDYSPSFNNVLAGAYNICIVQVWEIQSTNLIQNNPYSEKLRFNARVMQMNCSLTRSISVSRARALA